MSVKKMVTLNLFYYAAQLKKARHVWSNVKDFFTFLLDYDSVVHC